MNKELEEKYRGLINKIQDALDSGHLEDWMQFIYIGWRDALRLVIGEEFNCDYFTPLNIA